MINTFVDVAAKLAENEEAVGALYEQFAAAFPDDRELWAGLASEEAQHAQWIREAVSAMAPDARREPVPVIRLQAIVSMTAFVLKLGERCRRGEITRVNALALARDLENSVHEGKLLDVLSAAPATAVSVDKRLAAATAEHRARISATLQRARA